jgi:hypothetical protein
LEELKCEHCISLTSIPLISGLQNLYCNGCTLLCEIPCIDPLKVLDCDECPMLCEIPQSMQGLSELNCRECRSLTRIPPILDPESLVDFDFSGCIWLDINNPGYSENIRKLKVLQRWFRGIHASRKMLRLIPELIPIYYHPDSKGGYFHKKLMYDFLDSIQ